MPSLSYLSARARVIGIVKNARLLLLNCSYCSSVVVVFVFVVARRRPSVAAAVEIA